MLRWYLKLFRYLLFTGYLVFIVDVVQFVYTVDYSTEKIQKSKSWYMAQISEDGENLESLSKFKTFWHFRVTKMVFV